MSFKIVIEETKTVPCTLRPDDLVEERHYTDNEIQKDHRYMNEGDRATYKKKIYKTSEIPGNKEVTTKVFEQVVEQLDLKAVIGSINK